MTDVVVLGMGGSSLAPEVFRQSFPDAARPRACTCSTPRSRCRCWRSRSSSTSTRRCSSSPRSRAGRSSPTRCSSTSTACSPTVRTSSRSPTPARRWARSRPSTASAAPSSTTPTSAAATPRCRTSGSSPPRWRASTSALELDAAVAAQRASEDESGLWLGAALGALANAGRDKLAFVIEPPYESFGLWVEQLIAESTGKQGRGVLPIADEPLARRVRRGPRLRPHRHGRRRARRGGQPRSSPSSRPRSARCSSTSSSRPRCSAGRSGINPFDQPNVQEAKDNTSRVLAEGAPDLDDGVARRAARRPRAAVATSRSWATCPTTTRSTRPSPGCARAVIERHGVATTWGYGPRFLHSTGQYHKGGPPTGRFLQLVHDDDTDADVPGEDYDFRRLVAAQADGDLQTLRSPRPPGRPRPARRRRPAGRDRRTHRTRLNRPAA